MNKGYRMGLLLMVFLTVLVTALSALLYKVPGELLIISFVIILCCSIFLWTRKLSRGLLYIHNILNLTGAIALGYIISVIFFPSRDSIIGLIAGVVAVDVFSFTKRGGFTLNSKLINQTDMLARLSISSPLPQQKGLFPIIGIGDMVFYSMLSMSAFEACGISVFLPVVSILLIGQLLNIICILIISNKKWYRGFPATLMPGVLFFIGIAANIIKIN